MATAVSTYRELPPPPSLAADQSHLTRECRRFTGRTPAALFAEEAARLGGTDVDAWPERSGAAIPANGRLHVEGGLDDEFIRPLDVSPCPGTEVRALFATGVIDRELECLASRQLADGGWPGEFASYSPIAALEWRGCLTVRAMTTVAENI